MASDAAFDAASAAPDVAPGAASDVASDVALAQQLSDLTDFITPFAVQAACVLAVPDALAAGPLPVEQLASALGCQAPPLRRLLRTLSRKGIFDEPTPDVFALTPMGRLLRAEHPMSLRDANLPLTPNIESLHHLAHSVRTGQSAFAHLHGVTLWEHLASHPDEAEQFDRQMRSISGFEAASLLQSYDWEPARLVVDIGGGDGAFLQALLSRHRSVSGTLFDLPQVARKATDAVTDDDIARRFAARAGDFFTDDLPPGGDVYVLKRILYGFGDAEASTLLANLRRAMRPGAAALIVEPFTRGDGSGDSYFTYRVDLLMLACPGGRVRSERELASMLHRTGFEVRRVVASATPAIEAYAR